MHVNDIAESFLWALRSQYKDGELLVLNVGREDNNMKVIDIAEIVAEECGNIPVSFMTDSGESELIKNKLIGANGQDTRTYKVSFKKIKEYFPEFECRYSVRDGVRQMREKFTEIGLDRATFKDPKFYRLEAIDKLFREGAIDHDLRWISQQHAV